MKYYYSFTGKITKNWKLLRGPKTVSGTPLVEHHWRHLRRESKKKISRQTVFLVGVGPREKIGFSVIIPSNCFLAIWSTIFYCVCQ